MITPYKVSNTLLNKKMIKCIFCIFLFVSFVFVLFTDVYTCNYRIFLIQGMSVLLSVSNLFFFTLFTKSILKKYEHRHVVIKYLIIWYPFLFFIKGYIMCFTALISTIKFLDFACFLEFSLIVPITLSCCKLCLILEEQIKQVSNESLDENILTSIYDDFLQFCRIVYVKNIHKKIILFYIVFIFPLTIYMAKPIDGEQIRTMIEGTLFMTLFGYFVPRMIAKPDPLMNQKYDDISTIKQYNKNLMLFLFPLAITFMNVAMLVEFSRTKNFCDTVFLFPNIIMILSLFRSFIILDDYKNDAL